MGNQNTEITGSTRFPNDIKRIAPGHAWEYYMKNYKHKGVTKNIFVNINFRYNKWMSEQLAHGKRMMLPRRYGSVVFVREKRSLIRKDGSIRLPINWGATNAYNREHPDEKWKPIYHTPNAEGYLLRMVWIQRGSMFYRKGFFTLKMGRRLRLAVMKNFLSDVEFDDIELYEVHKPGRDTSENISGD